MMARFVVTRAPGPSWEPAKRTREQAGWDSHAAFMDALADERFVAFGGPAGNENKVVLVVDAPDEATIRARLALDPWTPAGLLRIVAIEPWTVWLGGDERIDTARARVLYLVAYRPGPAWDHAKPRRDQAGWDAHAAFMDTLTEQRVVIIGGPLDEQRALLVVQLDDEPTVRARLAADPWANSTLDVEYVEPWPSGFPRDPTRQACRRRNLSRAPAGEGGLRDHDATGFLYSSQAAVPAFRVAQHSAPGGTAPLSWNGQTPLRHAAQRERRLVSARRTAMSFFTSAFGRGRSRGKCRELLVIV
jgi:uncharacterized protein YciI